MKKVMEVLLVMEQLTLLVGDDLMNDDDKNDMGDDVVVLLMEVLKVTMLMN
jgi:hypothetical protein